MAFFKIFIFAHIACGGTALLTGSVSMLAAKGGLAHRLAGKIFFWAMAGVFITSLYMSLAKSNWFLLCVGFFSFYLTCSGYLVLRAKAVKAIETVKPIYFLVCLTGFLAGIAMLALAVNMFSNGYNFGIVPLVFGLLSAELSFLDYRQITTSGKLKQVWLKSHALRMAGAFVATLTAFIVVNIQIQQQWILWLLPTVLVIPATRSMIMKFEKR